MKEQREEETKAHLRDLCTTSDAPPSEASRSLVLEIFSLINDNASSKFVEQQLKSLLAVMQSRQSQNKLPTQFPAVDTSSSFCIEKQMRFTSKKKTRLEGPTTLETDDEIISKLLLKDNILKQ